MMERFPSSFENPLLRLAAGHGLHQITMPNAPQFVVGPLVPLNGGDGEALAVSGDRIATLGSHQATWWVNETPHTVELPGVPVRGARWSTDGNALLTGTGVIDVARETWMDHPAFERLVEPAPPGEGGVVVHTTSWSGDQRHAAALLKWSGPGETEEAYSERVMVLDLGGGTEPLQIQAKGASAVRIVDESVVVAADVVRVSSFLGAVIADLPATSGAPLAILEGGDGKPLLILDQDWSIRVVDTTTWTVLARWRGMFLDAVATPGGLIAVDHVGVLHAGCLDDGEVREVDTVATGILAAQLAATSDGRLVIVGAGSVPVHVMSFEVTCE